ncbi:rhamnogalacturonan acetylesterase [Microbacterium sp. G2-8]|uniref:rhamnogalacturonan acetylesterase n=1 Tax=Microbacterium sp. G2-8 TaxID=2842454 RepID=UPI0027E2B20F|nr:rhamnogalacturonan acetylesterase [Microbacterium sp. G2-8]
MTQLESPRTIFLAGDSTAAPKHADAAPEAGWGMALPWHLTPRLRLENHARNGRSTRSFVDQGRLAAILERIRPGDILLAQFGHNDGKSSDPERATDPWTSYQEHLEMYVAGAREHGATVVFATPIERRRFDEDGAARACHGDYPHAMRDLASRLGVPVVDAQVQSLALWQRLGPEASTRYFLHTDDGRRDDTHFQPPGAAEIAQIIVNDLRAQAIVEPHEVRRLDDPAPASAFEWLETAPA